MTRGYRIDEIREKTINALKNSKPGLSGVDIAKKLGVNRLTIAKYLKIFAAEGLIHQKNIGNVTIWSVEEGIEQYKFPDDYFQIESKFLDALVQRNENQAFSLIRNCLYSGATIPLLISEVIVPAISSVVKLYDDGKIGYSEAKFLENIISNSLQIFYQLPAVTNPNKNVIIISADSQSELMSKAASSAFHSKGWQVFYLGDMSSSIDVLFDLDLQKFLGKIWKQKSGIMIVAVFADTEEGLNFFANSINTIKKKVGKNLYLALCGKVGKKTKITSDLLSTKIEDVLNWSDSFENYESK